MTSLSPLLVALIALVTLGVALAAADPPARAPGAGTWLKSWKDACNTSRADLPGALSLSEPPREVWRYGHEQTMPSGIGVFELNGRRAFLLQRGWRLDARDAEGKRLWDRPAIGVSQVIEVIETPAGPRLIAQWGVSGLVVLDGRTGRPIWKQEPTEGIIGWAIQRFDDGFRIFFCPANTTEAMAFEFAGRGGEARLLWKQDYAGRYLANFGPALLLADMDNDGQQDLVLVTKPAYAAVIDTTTGRIKFDLQYKITGGAEDVGRPYGFVQAVDLDGDGFRDLVVIGYRVEEYLSVIKNEGGRSFRPLWSRFVEKDFPEDHRELHPAATSLADLNGDGKPELVIGLFNMNGDQRWHTLVLDPLKGLDAPLFDWPDRYFIGCFPLAGGSTNQVIVQEAKQRRPAPHGLIEAREGVGGTVIASLTDAAVSTVGRSSGVAQPAGIAHLSERQDPLCVAVSPSPAERQKGSPSARGLVVNIGSDHGGEQVWRIEGGRSAFAPFKPTAIARMVITSRFDTGDLPGDLEVKGAVAAQGPAAGSALIAPSGADGRHELIIAQSDGSIVGGRVNFADRGRLQDGWKITGVMPVVWVGPDGRRIVAALDADSDGVWLHEPPGGKPRRIALPFPPRRDGPRGGPLVPFTERGGLRLLVGLQTGRDTAACALYDGEGKQLWLDADHGPYPFPPVSADFDGDGTPELLIDDHGWQAIYRLDGSHHLFAQAWHDTVPGRADGAAHALPIVGPFGPGGELRMFMSPGFSAMEVLDKRGERLVNRKFDGVYEYYLANSAVGRPRGAVGWDAAVIQRTGIFECVGLEDLRTRWSVDLGQTLLPFTRVVAGDLAGNGRDSFLIGTGTGELIAVGESEGRGRVLWKVAFDAEVTDLIFADADGDGRSEIIVTTGDGFLHVLK